MGGLVLEKELIRRLLRQEIVRESVIYQDILAEGKQAGKQEGRQEGIREVAVNMLNSGMSLEQIAGLTSLSVEQVRQIQQAQT